MSKDNVILKANKKGTFISIPEIGFMHMFNDKLLRTEKKIAKAVLKNFPKNFKIIDEKEAYKKSSFKKLPETEE